MNRRGLVLLQVMMLSIITCYLLALILSMLLQPSQQGANVVNGVTSSLSAQAAVNRVQDAWSAAGSTCASASDKSVVCSLFSSSSQSESSSPCACSCTVSGVTVSSAQSAGGACTLTASLP
jgi:hypothetical protein